jgi:hypothetical protein
MNFRKSVYSIFSWLSRLYPKEYQQEYSEDMKSVFLDILEESGNWHAIRCLLRECVCLPACLLREYFSIYGGGKMKSTRQIISATIIGFISLNLLLEFLSRTLFPSHQYYSPQPLGNILLQLILTGILYGIFVGGAIGFAFSIKNKLAIMAIYGFAFSITAFIISSPWIFRFPNPWWEYVGDSFFFYAETPFVFFCIGLLSGFLWKGWKMGIVFGLASSLLFTIGWWITLAALSFVWGQGMIGIVDVQTLSEKLPTAHWLAFDLIYGGILGILWGIFLDRLLRVKSLKLSSAGN